MGLRFKTWLCTLEAECTWGLHLDLCASIFHCKTEVITVAECVRMGYSNVWKYSAQCLKIVIDQYASAANTVAIITPATSTTISSPLPHLSILKLTFAPSAQTSSPLLPALPMPAVPG